jgi:hypothetical protein
LPLHVYEEGVVPRHERRVRATGRGIDPPQL